MRRSGASRSVLAGSPPPTLGHHLRLPPVEVTGYSHTWRGVRWRFGLFGQHLLGRWDALTIQISLHVTLSCREPIFSDLPEGFSRVFLYLESSWGVTVGIKPRRKTRKRRSSHGYNCDLTVAGYQPLLVGTTLLPVNGTGNLWPIIALTSCLAGGLVGAERFTNIRIIGLPERQPVENNELVSMGSGMDREDLLIYSTIFHRSLESS